MRIIVLILGSFWNSAAGRRSFRETLNVLALEEVNQLIDYVSAVTSGKADLHIFKGTASQLSHSMLKVAFPVGSLVYRIATTPFASESEELTAIRKLRAVSEQFERLNQSLSYSFTTTEINRHRQEYRQLVLAKLTDLSETHLNWLLSPNSSTLFDAFRTTCSTNAHPASLLLKLKALYADCQQPLADRAKVAAAALQFSNSYFGDNAEPQLGGVLSSIVLRYLSLRAAVDFFQRLSVPPNKAAEDLLNFVEARALDAVGVDLHGKKNFSPPNKSTGCPLDELLTWSSYNRVQIEIYVRMVTLDVLRAAYFCGICGRTLFAEENGLENFRRRCDIRAQWILHSVNDYLRKGIDDGWETVVPMKAIESLKQFVAGWEDESAEAPSLAPAARSVANAVSSYVHEWFANLVVVLRNSDFDNHYVFYCRTGSCQNVTVRNPHYSAILLRTKVMAASPRIDLRGWVKWNQYALMNSLMLHFNENSMEEVARNLRMESKIPWRSDFSHYSMVVFLRQFEAVGECSARYGVSWTDDGLLPADEKIHDHMRESGQFHYCYDYYFLFAP